MPIDFFIPEEVCDFHLLTSTSTHTAQIFDTPSRPRSNATTTTDQPTAGEKLFALLHNNFDPAALILEHLDPVTRICFALTNKANADLAFAALKRPDDWECRARHYEILLKRLQEDGNWFYVSPII